MKKSILKSNGIGISRRNSIAGGNSLFSHNNMMLHGKFKSNEHTTSGIHVESEENG